VLATSSDCVAACKRQRRCRVVARVNAVLSGWARGRVGDRFLDGGAASLLHKRAGTVIARVGLLLIAVLTLTPDFAAGTQPPSLCLICGARGGEDALLNVLLFIPFGFGLRLSGMNRLRAWALAVATTVTVESLQIYIPGRDSTLGDVVMNSIGAFVGILCCDSLRIWLFPNVRQAKWLLLSGSLVWLLLVALGGWAMTPWTPPGPYVAQLAPDLPDIELFAGRVVDARINGETIVADAPLPSANSVRDSVLRGTLTLEARIVPTDPTYGLAPIVSIAGAAEPEFVVLGQDHRDAVVRLRLHAGQMRMNIPDVAALGVFPPHQGSLRTTPEIADTFRLRGEVLRGSRLRVSISSRGLEKTEELSLNPFLLWSLATPGERRTPRAFAIESTCWVMMLLAPLGYWAGRWEVDESGRNDFRSRIVSVLLLVSASAAGLAAIPPQFGFSVANVSLWIAAAIATSAAFWIGVRSTRTLGYSGIA
jgi:VanZ like protein